MLNDVPDLDLRMAAVDLVYESGTKVCICAVFYKRDYCWLEGVLCVGIYKGMFKRSDPPRDECYFVRFNYINQSNLKQALYK